MRPSRSSRTQNKAASESGGTEKLEQYFSALRNTDYNGTQPEVEQWLYTSTNQLQTQRKERKLKKMKNYFLANKLRLAYPIIFLAILVGACSMPVTQTETLGHVISWTADKDNTSAVEQISKLGWIKNGNFNSNENVNNGKAEMLYTLTLTNSTDKQVEGYVKELQAIKGVNMIKAVPISNNVKRPLYSAALSKFFSIDINATGMSDEELQKEVARQLKEQGVEMNVDIKTNSEGRREIRMQMPEGQINKEPKNFEMKIEDGNNVEKMKVVHKDQNDMDRFKGKTDEEIRNMIRQDLENPGLRDDEIKITRENGDVKVKIEVSHEDVKVK
jgi:hypothetical protein